MRATTIKSKERDVRHLLRGYILSWPCICFALFSASFVALFTPGGLLVDYPLWVRFAINLGNVILFLGFSYAALPPVFQTAFARGWPLLWSQVFSYFPPSIAAAALFTVLDGADLNSWQMALYFSIVMMIMITSVVGGLLLFWVLVLPLAGIALSPAQLWSFRPMGECQLQALLSKDVRGRVLRMVAENQYVRVVTEAGEDLIRLPLAEAVDLVPHDVGLRIHRSHWVAKDLIQSFRFESGNPRLTTTDGKKLPVSRNMVDSVREALEHAERPVYES